MWPKIFVPQHFAPEQGAKAANPENRVWRIEKVTMAGHNRNSGHRTHRSKTSGEEEAAPPPPPGVAMTEIETTASAAARSPRLQALFDRNRSWHCFHSDVLHGAFQRLHRSSPRQVTRGSQCIFRPFLWANTAVLLASSFTLEVARRRLSLTDLPGFRKFWMVTTVLGFVFVAGQLIAWRQLVAQGIYIASNQASSFFYIFHCCPRRASPRWSWRAALRLTRKFDNTRIALAHGCGNRFPTTGISWMGFGSCWRYSI